MNRGMLALALVAALSSGAWSRPRRPPRAEAPFVRALRKLGGHRRSR